MAEDIGIDFETFARLSPVYRQRWAVTLCATDADGRVVHGQVAGGICLDGASDCQARRQAAIFACHRWGEPTIEACACGQFIWAVPLMRNQQVLGGLVAGAPESQVLPGPGGQAVIDMRASCTDLRVLAERENLTNGPLLEARRKEYLREQLRADALHEFKETPYDSIRELFLLQEPSLMAAIRRGDPRAAREIINTILVAMLQRAGEDVRVAKTFFLELVVMMCRTAVETGGSPEQLLGANFQSLSRLSALQSSEELAAWLHEVLEHVMTTISDVQGRQAIVPIKAALEFMTEHLGENIGRDDIARAAHLSPFYFSRLFRRELGMTCTECLNQMRIERAAELLMKTDMPLARITLNCGFSDQSYFTKTFRKITGQTPRAFRESRRNDE